MEKSLLKSLKIPSIEAIISCYCEVYTKLLERNKEYELLDIKELTIEDSDKLNESKKNQYLFTLNLIKDSEELINMTLSYSEEKDSLLMKEDGEKPSKNTIKELIINYLDELNLNISNDDEEKLTKTTFKGYFKLPLLLVLIVNISVCISNNYEFVFKFLDLNSFIEDLTEKSINTIREKLKLMKSNNYENMNTVLALYNQFTPREILTFLGIRTTPGSVDEYLPLKIETIEYEFNKPHTTTVHPTILKKNPSAKPPELTVGARAFCKHGIRSSDGFWPIIGGGDKEKNQKSKLLLEKFLKNCIWINIHGLPHEIPTLEIRVKEGYGARWLSNGEFRGFLEPPMIDGHSKSWKH